MSIGSGKSLSLLPSDERQPLCSSPVSKHSSMTSLSPLTSSLDHLDPQVVQWAIHVSLAVNIALALAKLYATIASGSLAVLSSLVDSILDLTSQALFWFTDKYMHTPSVEYPAGRRRLEPIAVIVSATLMGMAALEVVQNSAKALIHGFHQLHRLDSDKVYDYQLDMTPAIIAILCTAVFIKLGLWWYCRRVARLSPSADALAQDHRNDVLSNTVAVLTSLLAHRYPQCWFADPIGAILISIYITFSWFLTGKEQVERLVGIQADRSFIQYIADLADSHHPMMKSDIVRAYHFGNNFLVELEVILPHHMCVSEAHDISLALQMKVEALDVVERAFVHVDYLSRNYDEHKDPTLRRCSST